MTESVNPTLTRAEDLFKQLVWDVIIAAGLDYLFIQVPVLAVWPLQPIIRSVAGLVSNKLYAALRLAVDLEAVRLLNDAHQRAYDGASVTLKIIAIDKGIDSDEYRKAKESAQDALAKFVRFNIA